MVNTDRLNICSCSDRSIYLCIINSLNILFSDKMMLENVKKCKNFLSTLLKLAANQPATTVKNVRDLIQGLIVSDMWNSISQHSINCWLEVSLFWNTVRLAWFCHIALLKSCYRLWRRWGNGNKMCSGPSFILRLLECFPTLLIIICPC